MNPEDFFEIKMKKNGEKPKHQPFPKLTSNKLIFLFCYILLPLQ